MLTDAILTAFKKRVYVSYKHQRTTGIWSSRSALLSYQKALEIEFEIDSLLDGTGGEGAINATGRSSSVTQIPTPVKCKKSGDRDEVAAKGKGKEEAVEDEPEKESTKSMVSKAVVDIFEEMVWERWTALLAVKNEAPERALSLVRFEEGTCVYWLFL